MSAPSPVDPVTDQALALLRQLGADDVPHPGGTLRAHLRRVQRQLAAWGARPALQLAGLCHAVYGTDGFAAALLPVDRRPFLASVIGVEAESIVYLYACCDRAATYPSFADPDAPFRDRFTGRSHTPSPARRRDFAELTAANELDLVRRDPTLRAEWDSGPRTLFLRLRPFLSPAARRDCVAVLGESESDIGTVDPKLC